MRVSAAALLILLVLSLAACGVGGSSPVSAGAGKFVPADDPGLRYEGHWDRKATATTNNSGSRIRFAFSGPLLKGRFNTEGVTQPAQVYVAIDDGDLVQYLVDQLEIDFTPGGLSSGDHTALFVVRDVNEHAERWTTPFQSILQLEGFFIDGKMLPAPAAKSLRMEFYGDSITQGVLTDCGYADSQAALDYVNGQTNNKCSDGTHGYAYLVARAFDAEVNQVGFGSQGILKGGAGGVPKAADSFGFNFAGSPADPSFLPGVVVINQGTNDSTGTDTAGFQTGYEAFLRQVRAAYPDAWILALALFGAEGGGSDFNLYIQTAVTAVADPKIVYVDTTAWSGGGQFDPIVHLHPLVATSRNIADKLIPKITEITGISPAASPDLR